VGSSPTRETQLECIDATVALSLLEAQLDHRQGSMTFSLRGAGGDRTNRFN
jgi:hypothetical protein